MFAPGMPIRNEIKDAVELRLSVKGRKPPVWRRVLVHPDTNLEELHGMVTLLLGWDREMDHHFKVRRDEVRLSDPEYRSLRVSELEPGEVIDHINDGGERSTCRVKVIDKERERLAKLPILIDGMRTLAGGPDDDPYAIGMDRIESELQRFRRYDDKVPDRDGKMIELWQATALTCPDDPRDDLLKELAKIMPLSKRAEARLRPCRPLEPVPDKVPPRTSVDLRIKLMNMPVPVWRLLRVNSETTFHQLHRAIQGSFGWADYHLYEFKVGDSSIQSFAEEDVEDFPVGMEVIDSGRIHLRDIMGGKGWSIPYLYDFGDGWMHIVKVVKVHLGQSSPDRVELLDGSGACPPEDCGGGYGYQELISVVNDPRHPEHDDMAEWFGSDSLDPKAFDIQAARKRLGSMMKML